jgi:hypothetical protein
MDRDLALKFVEDKEREVEEVHYQLGLAHSSPLMTDTPSSLAAVTQESGSLTHDVREETLMMSQDEEQSEMHVPEESDSLVCTLDWHCEDHEHFPLESTLEAQGLAMEEMVEYIPCGPSCKEIYIYSDWVDRYMTYMDTLWDTGSVIISRVLGSVVHTGYRMMQEDTVVCSSIQEPSLTHGGVRWSFRAFPPGRPPDRVLDFIIRIEDIVD